MRHLLIVCSAFRSLTRSTAVLSRSLQSFLQLDCLSNGLLDFYTKWSIRVFVIPALLLGLVGLQYCYERRRAGASAAVGIFKANVSMHGASLACCAVQSLADAVSVLS